ncbi:MAG: DUF1566 domain-containing protein [Victivallales bacterium]|nr:DUF1566 domain-containing protein [Victivallales bacterium]
MAAKRPQEPLEQSEAQQLRAQRREERVEAKRQRRELARIERDMRGPGPRWVLPAVIGGIALLAILAFVGYKTWSNAVIDAAQRPFEESHGQADKQLLETYAASDWQKITELKKKAEARNGGPKAVAKLYQEADELLVEALSKAGEAQATIELSLTTFEGLYKQAVALGIGELLPKFWTGVESARKRALADGVSNADRAKHYNRGSALLGEVEHDFSRIRELRQNMGKLAQASTGFTPEQHAKAFPEEAKAYVARLAIAEKAVATREWKQAVVLHDKLIGETLAITKKIQQAKDAAAAAASVFWKALAGAKGKGAPRDAKTAWEALVAEQAALLKAMAAFEYAAVQSRAKVGTAKVAEMLKQITEARNTLAQRRQDAEEGYLQAAQDKSFYEANLAEDWGVAVTSYKAMRKTVTDGADIVSQLRAADALKTNVVAIVARKKTMEGGLVEVRDRLAALQASPFSKLVTTNLPAAGAAIARVSSQAKEAVNRGDMKVAVAKHEQWTAQLGKAIAKVKEMMEGTVESARDCAARRKAFQMGIDAFRPAKKARIASLSEESRDLVAKKNFKDALPLLKRLDGLVPAQRFTVDKPKTVSDNKFGIMWASDGKGAGCLGGKKVNWHEAYRRATELDFAGYDDWVLPTEEELRLASEVSVKEYRQAFPNSPIDIYWTGVPDTTNVNQALAIELKEVTPPKRRRSQPTPAPRVAAGTILRPKNQPHHVRVMRKPK